MSTFPDRIYQMGGVPVGSVYGMQGGSKVYFVDGETGSDGNSGESPTLAFKTILKGITSANAWDVIYIAPMDYTTDDMWLNTAYRETVTDLSIPFAKHGLAMVGIGHQAIRGEAYSTVIYELEGTSNAILTVNAPMCAFENLSFRERGTTDTQIGIYLNGNVDSTSEACLETIYNCHFKHLNANPATSATSGGAIYSDGAWGLTVNSCNFIECGTGICFKSNVKTAGNFVAMNNKFFSYTVGAGDIGCDIEVYTQGAASLLIADNYFAHDRPDMTGSAKVYIACEADVTAGLIANNIFASADTLTSGAAGDAIICPTAVGCGPNYVDGAIITHTA